MFSLTSVLAQAPNPAAIKKLDSLKRELKIAKDDTIKIRLRISIGFKENVADTLFWQKLISETQKFNLKVWESRVNYKLGRIYNSLNNSNKAIECYNRSLKIAEVNGYKNEMISPAWSLSSHYCNIAYNFDKAIELSYKGLKVTEELNRKDISFYFCEQLGQIYFLSGEPKKALAQHLSALQYLKASDDYGAIVSILCDIGSDYIALRDTANSVYYYMQTAKYLNVTVNTMHAAEANKAIASAFELKNQLDSSEHYYSKALAIYESLKNIGGKATVMVQLAMISYKKENNLKAKEQALLALQFCEEAKLYAQIPDVAFLLKKIYLKEKDYKSALEAYETYIISKDSLSNEKNRKLATEKQFAYEFEKKENENKLLVQQNQIQSLELKQNNYFIIGLVALLGLIFVIGILFIRQNKLKGAQQSARFEQKLLLSQMNPHFIFNSLQAIQNFILKNDEKKGAIKYLSSFANVTRNVLENSRMEVISIKKEITLLENYLQLQKLRFKERFNYEIRVDEKIDVEIVRIPPMLSQPFIENAIEHGFSGIENDGKISISYTIDNNELLMEIIDNGIGMKASYSENKQHQSLAFEITKERIALMNKKVKRKIIFTIGAAFPMQKERKGVKITFRFPINS